MRTQFLNCSKEDRKAFRAEGRRHLLSRADDFKFWIEHGTDSDGAEDPDQWNKKAEEQGVGSFYEYGLSVDYVAPHIIGSWWREFQIVIA